MDEMVSNAILTRVHVRVHSSTTAATKTNIIFGKFIRFTCVQQHSDRVGAGYAGRKTDKTV